MADSSRWYLGKAPPGCQAVRTFEAHFYIVWRSSEEATSHWTDHYVLQACEAERVDYHVRGFTDHSLASCAQFNHVPGSPRKGSEARTELPQAACVSCASTVVPPKNWTRFPRFLVNNLLRGIEVTPSDFTHSCQESADVGQHQIGATGGPDVIKVRQGYEGRVDYELALLLGI